MGGCQSVNEPVRAYRVLLNKFVTALYLDKRKTEKNVAHQKEFGGGAQWLVGEKNFHK